ncbi:MAG: hypothetical protein IK955_07005 [Clostridia bacterium]|nr:hypothetical protein [Clostridia bacterium]
MDIQPLGSNKFLVSLSPEDLRELDITYDTMDYSNIETRRVIWTILDYVRRNTGRDIDPSGNLLIEASPDGAGGCILLFTVPVSRTGIGTVISKTDSVQIFEFRSSDDLLDAMSAVGKGSIDGRIFTDGRKFRAELPSEKATVYRHIIEEFGIFIGNDSLTVTSTHEHWKELSKSTS